MEKYINIFYFKKKEILCHLRGYVAQAYMVAMPKNTKNRCTVTWYGPGCVGLHSTFMVLTYLQIIHTYSNASEPTTERHGTKAPTEVI